VTLALGCGILGTPSSAVLDFLIGGDRGFLALGKCRLGRYPQRWTGSRERGLSQPQRWARVINRAVSFSIGLTLIVVGVPTSLFGYSRHIACLFGGRLALVIIGFPNLASY